MISFKNRILSIVLVCLISIVLIIPVSAVGQYEYVVPPKELWTCFDHTMHYSQNNPEWGVVLMSKHPQFRGCGNSHMVNYQIVDDALLIHDEQRNWDYKIFGWEFDSDVFKYYHFYVNGEIPTRHFRYKLPNAEEVYHAI